MVLVKTEMTTLGKAGLDICVLQYNVVSPSFHSQVPRRGDAALARRRRRRHRRRFYAAVAASAAAVAASPLAAVSE